MITLEALFRFFGKQDDSEKYQIENISWSDITRWKRKMVNGASIVNTNESHVLYYDLSFKEQ